MRNHLLASILIIGIIASSTFAFLPAHAASGTYFDNIVIIAMENTGYQDVIGSSSQAPFINNQLVPLSANLAHYQGYGAGGRSVNGCSAGCYTALIGADNSISDGYSCCLPGPTVVDGMAGAGLSWQAYCESGCPRGNDHFPFTGFATTSSSSNIFTSGSVSTATFIAAANAANPPNFLWYTPTDGHNMHDNSVASGDSYVQSFLVGSGTVSSPASGSLLASNLFTSGKRVLLLLWWDECGASNGGSGCNGNGDTPNVWYGPHAGIKAGFTSQVNNVYDEYSILHLIENNWGLSTLNSNDAAGSPMTDIFGTATPPALTTSFTVSPTTPVVNSPVTFTATAVGGMGPYTVSWDFGDGNTATGASVTHIFAGVQSYTVTETVQDSSSPPNSSTSSQTVSNKAASGGSGNGSGGGSGGSSSGGCFLCNNLPSSSSIWLLAVGGLLGIVGSLVLLTIRARANLAKTKRRMNHTHR